MHHTEQKEKVLLAGIVAGRVCVCECVCVCVGRGELCCLGAYLLQEMVARHAKRWRGKAADSHRQAGRQAGRQAEQVSDDQSILRHLLYRRTDTAFAPAAPSERKNLSIVWNWRVMADRGTKCLCFWWIWGAGRHCPCSPVDWKGGELAYCVSVRAELDRCPAK